MNMYVPIAAGELHPFIHPTCKKQTEQITDQVNKLHYIFINAQQGAEWMSQAHLLLALLAVA